MINGRKKEKIKLHSDITRLIYQIKPLTPFSQRPLNIKVLSFQVRKQ